MQVIYDTKQTRVVCEDHPDFVRLARTHVVRQAGRMDYARRLIGGNSASYAAQYKYGDTYLYEVCGRAIQLTWERTQVSREPLSELDREALTECYYGAGRTAQSRARRLYHRI